MSMGHIALCKNVVYWSFPSNHITIRVIISRFPRKSLLLLFSQHYLKHQQTLKHFLWYWTLNQYILTTRTNTAFELTKCIFRQHAFHRHFNISVWKTMTLMCVCDIWVSGKEHFLDILDFINILPDAMITAPKRNENICEIHNFCQEKCIYLKVTFLR